MLSSEGARSAWNFNLRGDGVLAGSAAAFFDFSLTAGGIGVLLHKAYSECVVISSVFRFIVQSSGISFTLFGGVGTSAAICSFSSSRSAERLIASHGLGHESFGDILAVAWLGLLPSGLRDSARRTCGTRRRAGDPGVGRRRSVRHSSLIVGNPRHRRPLGAGPRIRCGEFKSKKQSYQLRFLLCDDYARCYDFSRTLLISRFL